jgi:hypothetical protein
MSKAEKRDLKIRKNPHNVSLVDFESLIKRYGKIIEGGNYPKAHIGNHVYPYKRENPVKTWHIEAIIRFIDELEGEQAYGFRYERNQKTG